MSCAGLSPGLISALWVAFFHLFSPCLSYAECIDNSGCVPYETCTEEGICVLRDGACYSDDDCLDAGPPGEGAASSHCSARGYCRTTGCETDDDCSPNEFCDDFHLCEPGCTVDEDCDVDWYCVEGECVTQPAVDPTSDAESVHLEGNTPTDEFSVGADLEPVESPASEGTSGGCGAGNGAPLHLGVWVGILFLFTRRWWSLNRMGEETR